VQGKNIAVFILNAAMCLACSMLFRTHCGEEKDFFDVQKGHIEIINDALFALSQNGIIYFSTNFSKFV
jgi:hypothetical protein